MLQKTAPQQAAQAVTKLTTQPPHLLLCHSHVEQAVERSWCAPLCLQLSRLCPLSCWTRPRCQLPRLNLLPLCCLAGRLSRLATSLAGNPACMACLLSRCLESHEARLSTQRVGRRSCVAGKAAQVGPYPRLQRIQCIAAARAELHLRRA